MCNPHGNRASKHITQKLLELKGEIDKCMIIVGDFNSNISGTEWTSRQDINKDMKDLNNPINQCAPSETHKSSKPERHTFKCTKEQPPWCTIILNKTPLNKVKALKSYKVHSLPIEHATTSKKGKDVWKKFSKYLESKYNFSK